MNGATSQLAVTVTAPEGWEYLLLSVISTTVPMYIGAQIFAE